MLDWFWLPAFCLLIVGLFFGSFFNVVACRVPKGESVVYPPSHCPVCRHRLKPIDLVPILSFLFLRGRCRYCRSPISWYYPLGEFLMLAGTWTALLRLGWQWETLIGAVFLSFLVILTLTDLREMLIPNLIVYSGILVLAALRLFIHPLALSDYVIGSLIGTGLFGMIYLLTKGRGIGGGDVKLMALIGLAVGWQLTLMVIFMASLLGSLIGGVLMLFKVIRRRQPIPFGPFLALSGWLTYLWGSKWMDWYLRLFQ
jgi:leader peptidase (prepilin peptidase)/N-methyltransferase